MEYRRLGRTGMVAGVLGFGGAEIGFEDASERDVENLVRAALEAGVNVFDTAECYGESESKLGPALKAHRKRVLLFTKCGHSSGLEGKDWDPDMLTRSIDRSLQRLQTDYVDLLQLHSCSAELLEAGDVVDVLRRAREQGKTRFIGYSGDGADAEAAVRLGVFDTLQTSINVADQEALTRTLPLAVDAEMGVIAKRPIANAAWKYEEPAHDEYHYEYWRRLQKLDYDFLKTSVPETVGAALRFTLALPGVGVAIVGTKSPERFVQNTRMLGALPPEQFIAIRERWREVAEPGWVGQV